ncbi:MAG: RNA-binding protein [Clostridiales bacterium]|nr:RNA-binding protein [Clostridiales bacterium]
MKVGDIVISTYGHDMGDWFIVKQLDGDYVYLVDGKNRPIEKPKKKNLKHIVATNKTASDLIERLVGEQKIQNAELRKTLKFFKEQF